MKTGEGEAAREMTQEEWNRENMSPRDYLAWKLEGMFPSEREEILKRKGRIQTRITSAVRGPAGLTNTMIDQIVSGDVPDEAVDKWTEEVRRAKSHRLSESMEKSFRGAGYPTKGSQPASDFSPEE